MESLINNMLFGVVISLIAFELALIIRKKTGIVLLNPLLVSIIMVIVFLLLFNIDVEIYNVGGDFINMFLGPATVVLAVPLYNQLDNLKRYAVPIVVGIFIGTIIGVISIIISCVVFDLNEEIIASLLPKSITTPIGIEICLLYTSHATIRAFLLNEDEKEHAPKDFKVLNAKGVKDPELKYFTIGVSPLDCVGCGNCAEICPAPGKALIMKPQQTQHDQIEPWNYATDKVKNKANPMKKATVKGSQFERPLLEYSGACAGCGETPYAKLVTQLFGDRMMIANATGCTSIWAAAGAATAYSKNQNGHGPAWANSLFEDNAEYGLGMYLGVKAVRERIASNIEKALESDMSEEVCLLYTSRCV